MKTIGLTGARGWVGKYLTSHYVNFIDLGCDVTDLDEIDTSLQRVHPDIVLHLAAKSDVNWCQDVRSEKTLFTVNVRGTFNVCVAAEKACVPVVLLSTDHVFSGDRGKYKEKDRPFPVNQYGMSKFSAESLQTAFSGLKIIRASYLFDWDRLSSHYLLKEVNGRMVMYEPTFISRSFMYLPHFAESLEIYLEQISEMPKILHISGTECVSWYEFMGYVIGPEMEDVLLPIKEYDDSQVPRPKKGGLNTSLSSKLGFPQFGYDDGIYQMKADIER